MDQKNNWTEGTTIQVLKNISDIHMNMGSDNNQADTTYLQRKVFITSKRQKKSSNNKEKIFLKVN